MNQSSAILAFFQNIGPMEMLVIGVVALLLFGKRLPEVGRSLGKGIVEFKKGLRDVEDEVHRSGDEKSGGTNSNQTLPPPPGSNLPGAGG